MKNLNYDELTPVQKEKVAALFDSTFSLPPQDFSYDIGTSGQVLSRRRLRVTRHVIVGYELTRAVCGQPVPHHTSESNYHHDFVSCDERELRAKGSLLDWLNCPICRRFMSLLLSGITVEAAEREMRQ